MGTSIANLYPYAEISKAANKRFFDKIVKTPYMRYNINVLLLTHHSGIISTLYDADFYRILTDSIKSYRHKLSHTYATNFESVIFNIKNIYVKIITFYTSLYSAKMKIISSKLNFNN